MIMKTVAVSELKASLSGYLSKIKAGEEVLITERGKPIAKLVPLHREKTKIPAHLLTLERAGLAKIGTEKLPADFWRLPRPKNKEDLALNALLKEREESR